MPTENDHQQATDTADTASELVALAARLGVWPSRLLGGVV